MLLALFAAGCAPERPAPGLTLAPTAFSALRGWKADDHAAAAAALRRSCAARAERMAPAPAARPQAVWQAACAALADVPEGDRDAARAYFETWFEPFTVAAGEAREGLLTGYYEPELRGSRRRHGRYDVPLYLRPPELVTVDLGAFRPALAGERIAGRVAGGRLVPFADRAAIEGGALAGRGLELVWVDDPVAAFFLHVQGSGRIVLDDGTAMRVGYAAANGHPYTAIGRTLIDAGEIAPERMSMQAIRGWLEAHPARARAVMAQNASYVFFREIDGPGPIGAEGVALTAGRSLAVDPRYHAFGTPVWIETEDPLRPGVALHRLAIAQDGGAAIRGPLRGDLFFGHGPEAAAAAGRMKAPVRFTILLPRRADAPTG